MKKQISILLSLLVVFSSLIVSCDDGGDDLNPNICKITVSSGGNGRVSITNYIGTSENVLLGSNIEVVATPDAGCEFLGWFVGDSEKPISTDAEYTFTVSESVTLVAKFKNQFDANGSIGGHAYVDLGLSVKWATCNVGATKPEEYGDYFAWGETEEKEYYGWGTYKWCNGSYYTMTKYCINSSYGTVDYNIILDPEDDVAHVKWGGKWRMPTTEEQKELLDNCTWEWTSLNGVNGYKVTSKTNGNSIFVPAAGYRSATSLSGEGSYGSYWSSTPSENRASNACSLLFGSGYYDWGNLDRSFGLSVRPVSK